MSLWSLVTSQCTFAKRIKITFEKCGCEFSLESERDRGARSAAARRAGRDQQGWHTGAA